MFAMAAVAALAFPVVASAAVCDLTEGSGTTNCAIAGSTGSTGLFYTDEQHPTGTGVIDSFLRLQQNGYEQGYNTSARSYGSGTQFDEKTDPNFTRNLLTSELETVKIGNTTYMQFLLDLNEPNSATGTKYLITLDQLEIFVSNTPNLDTYSPNNVNQGNDAGGSLTGAVKIFDMDSNSTDSYVQLDYRVSGQGSGSSDMAFYLDSSLFAGYQYVYLYSQFGDNKNKAYKYESQVGFEEWFSDKGPLSNPNTAVPEPATLLLLGSGLAVAARRKFRKA
jgi:hypothetical protein